MRAVLRSVRRVQTYGEFGVLGEDHFDVVLRLQQVQPCRPLERESTQVLDGLSCEKSDLLVVGVEELGRLDRPPLIVAATFLTLSRIIGHRVYLPVP